MTNLQLKAQIDAAVTNKVAEDSISPTDVGNNMDAIVDYVDQQDLLAMHLEGTEVINGAKTFTVPLEAIAFVATGGLPSEFLKADGTLDSTVYADDLLALHSDGNETVIGTKTFITGVGGTTLRVENTTVNQNGIEIDNTDNGNGIKVFNELAGRGVFIENLGTGYGCRVNNADAGIGIFVSNPELGDGVYIDNQNNGFGLHLYNLANGSGIEGYNNNGPFINITNAGSGNAIFIDNTGTSEGIVINNSIGNTTPPFVIKKTGTEVLSISDFGEISAGAFINPFGSATDFLMADGSLNSAVYITDANVLHKTGTETKTGKLIVSPATGDGLLVTSIDAIGLVVSTSSAVDPGLFAQNSNAGPIAQFSNFTLGVVAEINTDGLITSTGLNIAGSAADNITIDNQIGASIYTTMTADGEGFVVNNTTPNTVFTIENSGNGLGLVMNNSLASNGLPFIIRKNSVNKLTITDAGNVNANQYNITAMNTVPASAVAAGTLGEIRFTADHIYLCVAANTWKRVAIATF